MARSHVKIDKAITTTGRADEAGAVTAVALVRLARHLIRPALRAAAGQHLARLRVGHALQGTPIIAAATMAPRAPHARVSLELRAQRLHVPRRPLPDSSQDWPLLPKEHDLAR